MYQIPRSLIALVLLSVAFGCSDFDANNHEGPVENTSTPDSGASDSGSSADVGRDTAEATLGESCAATKCTRGLVCDQSTKTCNELIGCGEFGPPIDEELGCYFTLTGEGRVTSKECDSNEDCMDGECVYRVCQNLTGCESDMDCSEVCRWRFCQDELTPCTEEQDCESLGLSCLADFCR